MKSGIRFIADARDGASRRLGVSIELEGPFTENTLEFRFPRWVPGSYFIREPMQHLTGLLSTIDGEDAKAERIGVDGVRIRGVSDASKVVLTYKVLAVEMTCRANHIDTSHVHIMPPYTWVLPTRGISQDRMDLIHDVEIKTQAIGILQPSYLEVMGKYC